MSVSSAYQQEEYQRLVPGMWQAPGHHTPRPRPRPRQRPRRPRPLLRPPRCACASVVLDVSAKPVNATVLKQYIATTMKPATTRAKSDFLAILSFLSRLFILLQRT